MSTINSPISFTSPFISCYKHSDFKNSGQKMYQHLACRDFKYRLITIDTSYSNEQCHYINRGIRADFGKPLWFFQTAQKMHTKTVINDSLLAYFGFNYRNKRSFTYEYSIDSSYIYFVRDCSPRKIAAFANIEDYIMCKMKYDLKDWGKKK